jgi:hypothetical protein
MASLSMHRTYLAVLRKATLSGALFLFITSGVAMASNDLISLKEKLQQLRTATDIVLMIVPYPASFRVRVDEVQLPEVACVYEINSSKGRTFAAVLDIMDSAITEYDNGPKPGVDLRVGIIFKSDGKALQDFYFDDWGGDHKVQGFSGNRRISASADLPDRLRVLLTHRDVALVRDRHSRCPHS